jgi:hypothetical protein
MSIGMNKVDHLLKVGVIEFANRHDVVLRQDLPVHFLDIFVETGTVVNMMLSSPSLTLPPAKLLASET